METITIPKQEYEELIRKMKELELLQNQDNSQNKINSIEDLPKEIREEFEMWERASDEDLAEFERKNNL